MIPDAGANGMNNGFGVAGSASKDEGKGSGGGWSEVAKKGSQQQGVEREKNEAFKVVGGKRRGRK